MLSLDITGTLAQTITPSLGITDQEFTAILSSLQSHMQHITGERKNGLHAWTIDLYQGDSIPTVIELAHQKKSQSIETIVWIGMGGSALGPRVLQETFEFLGTPEFIILDTLDPTILKETLQILNWKKTLVVIASKSGTTLESMSVFFLLWDKLQEVHKEQAASYVIGITDLNNNPLRIFCQEKDIVILPIPPEVGGRFSVFTPIGLLPLALLGKDCHAFTEGARTMDQSCQDTHIAENIAMNLAGVQFLLDTKKSYPLRVIMPYSHRLRSIAPWDQQLIAESLGKTETHNPFPVAALGTADQHSLLQQWMAGPRKSWHLFIREHAHEELFVPNDIPDSLAYLQGKPFGTLLDACIDGTRQALTSVKRPHASLSLPSIDEYYLGQLFFCFMMEVILLSKLYRINPYDQPAVEIGKQITKNMLSEK